MKKLYNLLIVFLSLTLMASNCRKEGNSCHRTIIIKNNSSQDIIQSLKFTNPSNKCILSGSIIKSSVIYEFKSRDCWEDKLANGSPQEIYIVDPNNFNATGIFYDCDSIEIKNNILKHYTLTLNDLKNNNFTVTYP